MKKTILRKYAQLIAKAGINVQKGQEVFINAQLDQPEFVQMVVEECYRAGAKRVVVDWDYQPLAKIHYRWRSSKTLAEVPNYEEARWQHYLDAIPCRIYLLSEDPDGLRGINQAKVARQSRLSGRSSGPTGSSWKTNTSGALPPYPAQPGQKSSSPNLPSTRPLKSSGKPFSPPPGSQRTPSPPGKPTMRISPAAVPTSTASASVLWNITAPTARISV